LSYRQFRAFNFVVRQESQRTKLTIPAATMKASLTTTLTYFQAQKVDGAVALNEKALEHVAALEAGAKERDYRLVLEASTALNETCGACHTAHRVRTEDGAYEIKIK